VIGREGGQIDDGDACFVTGGPRQFLRTVTDAGVGSDLVWTYTTASASAVSFGHWDLNFAEAGRYRIEVSTPAPYASSVLASYSVSARGERIDLALDQTRADGWQVLGEVEFAAGGGQSIHLGDNTGEPGSADVQIAFDAIRLVRVLPDVAPPPPPDPEPEPSPEPEVGDEGGCSAVGAPGPGLPLAVLGLALAARRRRRAIDRAIPGRP
jgi:uncharacterized protein (TIGR03382 family)